MFTRKYAQFSSSSLFHLATDLGKSAWVRPYRKPGRRCLTRRTCWGSRKPNWSSLVLSQSGPGKPVALWRSKWTKNDSHPAWGNHTNSYHTWVSFVTRAPYHASCEILNCPRGAFTVFILQKQRQGSSTVDLYNILGWFRGNNPSFLLDRRPGGLAGPVIRSSSEAIRCRLLSLRPKSRSAGGEGRDQSSFTPHTSRWM